VDQTIYRLKSNSQHQTTPTEAFQRLVLPRYEGTDVPTRKVVLFLVREEHCGRMPFRDTMYVGEWDSSPGSVSE